jgi:DNA polymerase-3 subunit beta
MKIEAQKVALVHILTHAVRVAPKRPTVESVAYCRLDAGNGPRLDAYAHDGIGVCATMTAPVVVHEPGTIAIAASSLLDKVTSMPEGTISLSTKKDDLEILSVASKRKFRITLLDPASMSPIESTDVGDGASKIGGPSLRAALSRVSFAMSNELGRGALHGILFEPRESMLRLVATNGHALSMSDVPCEIAGGKEVLHASSVKIAEGFLGTAADIMVRIGGDGIRFGGDASRIKCKPVDQAFPPYDFFLQYLEPRLTNVVISRAELLESVKSILAAADEKSDVRVDIAHGRVRVSVSRSVADGEDEIECKIEGQDLSIFLQPNYLTSALEAIDSEDVRISAAGDRDPVAFCGEHARVVLMPTVGHNK